MKSETFYDEIHENIVQSGPAKEVHLLDLLITLSKRRKLILGFTLGVVIVASVVVLLISPKYTADTSVLPPSQNSSMSSALMGQLGGSSALASVAGASLGIKNPGDMYVSLFHSQTVEDSLVKRFDLLTRYHAKKMSEARTAFEASSTVALGAKDGLIRISVTDRDPKMAADIANGYVDEFRKLSASLASTEASQRRMFFQQQLKDTNESLTTAEEAMKQTEQSTGVMQVDSQARSLIESAAILRGQVVAKEVEIQALRSYATDDNPQMVMAEQQLAALKSQLAKLAGKDVDSGSDFIISKGNIPTAGLEYVRKLRDVRYYETVQQLIAKQFEIAKLDEARQGATVQVVDIATIPDKRSSPKRTLIVILAAFLAFSLSCGWCILAEAIQRMKSDPVEGQRLNALRATFRRAH